MTKRKTTEEFKKEVYDLVGNEYTVLGEYINSKTHIKIRHNCEKCNNYEWNANPGWFLRGTRCPKCNNNTKKTTEEFKKEVYDLVGNEYTVLGQYINNCAKIKIRHNCEKCNNYEYEVTSSDFKQGYRCPKCGGTKRKTTEEFKKEVYDLVGDEYTILNDYIDNKTKIKIRHNCEKCNNYEYEVSPNRFLSGNRCPKCGKFSRNEKRSNNINDFKKEVYDLVGNEYTVLGEYVNSRTKIKIRHNCEKCNNYEYEVRPNDFQQGKRCPKCSKNNSISKEEIELKKFLKSIYNETIIFNDRNILNGKELDIYLPKSNIAIEYDGLYWHSDIYLEKNYHLNKTNECNLKNIQLIHIFSDEWINKKDIVKSKLKHLLKCNNNPKIYARNCYIEKISSNKKNEFLNKNHIQGEDKANIKLGLFTKKDNKLVSVMTFCKPRKSLGQNNSKYDYELSRFANDINYIVIGSFGKLFSYFKNNYEWNKIITYADKRWSKGNVYIKNNFNKLDDSKISYWYSDNSNNKRFHRYSFRKSELKTKFPNIYNENLTEFEIMNNTKYTRIYDCGNLVFEYLKKK